MDRRKSRVLGRARDGTEITEAIAGQLADEAEAGYDLSHAARGRKSLAGGGGRSPRINVRVTPELDAKVRARARCEGKRRSDIAREALEHYVAES